MAGAKTGRRAGETDRAKAQRLVTVYRLARNSPDGRYCLNPDDALTEQTFVDVRDPSLLIWALENFAEHGTFHFVDTIIDSKGDEKQAMRNEFERLRSNGATYENAVHTLVDKHGKSASSIERLIRLGPLAKCWSYLQTVTPIDGDT